MSNRFEREGSRLLAHLFFSGRCEGGGGGRARRRWGVGEIERRREGQIKREQYRMYARAKRKKYFRSNVREKGEKKKKGRRYLLHHCNAVACTMACPTCITQRGIHTNRSLVWARVIWNLLPAFTERWCESTSILQNFHAT